MVTDILLNITLKGNPIANKRHRVRRIGNKVASYDPMSKQKEAIAWQIKAKYGKQPSKEILRVVCEFHIQTPTSWSKKKQKEVEGQYRPKRPDIDNFEKFYWDAMNGIVFEDDGQICESFSFKYYSSKPRTVIQVFVLDNTIDSDV